MYAIRSIASCLLTISALTNGGGKIFKHINGGLPANASICDGDTFLEGGRTLGRHLLTTFIDVGLDHDCNNAVLTSAELIGDGSSDLGLVAVVFK